MTSPDEGELVESGTFRVDTGRMLEILSRYQLESPEHFLRALIRCAVASGATGVKLDRASGPSGTGFMAAFDGLPFTKEELSDIYSPLLAGGQGRGRHLAVAVLALLKTKPAQLNLSSGRESVAVCGAPALQGFPGSGGRTVLRVLWEREPAELPLSRILDYPALSDAALACCPIAVSSPAGESRPFEKPGAPGETLYFAEGGRRGFIMPVRDDGSAPMTGFVPEADSAVNIHVSGVYAETHAAHMPLAPVSADINDDSLTLDASFGKCVRNERFAAALAFAEKKAEDLLLREVKKQRKDLAEVGQLVKTAKCRRFWRARMRYLSTWKAAVSPSGWDYLCALWRWLDRIDGKKTIKDHLPAPSLSFYACFNRTGPRTWWLQDACRRALKGRLLGDPGTPALRALWTSPVLLSTHGEVLTLADVHRRRSRGRLSVSKYFDGESSSKPDSIWLASFRDKEFLKEFVPQGDWDGDLF